jgi:hypothetical protein
MPEPTNRWANLRDICSAIREIVIVAAMICLLVVPSVVRQALERAGIRSVAGVEFDIMNLAQSREELDAALAQIDALRTQIATAQQQVQDLAESSPAAAMPLSIANETGPADQFSPSLQSVSRIFASMNKQIDETDLSLRRSKAHANIVMDQAKKRMELTPPEELFKNRDSSASVVEPNAPTELIR